MFAEPKRGGAFEFLHQVRLSDRPGELDKEVDVIFNAIDEDRMAAESRRDARQIGMRIHGQRARRQQWVPVFRRENQMHENSGEGLRLGRLVVVGLACGISGAFRNRVAVRLLWPCYPG